MSSFEPMAFRDSSVLRLLILGPLLALLLITSACTVRPLYGEASGSIGAGGGLGSIAVNPVTSRYAQEVRNHLIFGLNGGAGQPASPRYLLDLNVTSTFRNSASVQVARENEPTAGAVVMTSRYRLIDAETGKAVANGRRSVNASFDKPRQEFAVLRAERDAENRAARELAEMLRVALAQDLENLPAN
ncbi:MAG: LPS assembly lipoprotein LptE [Nitratireductor sp.]